MNNLDCEGLQKAQEEAAANGSGQEAMDDFQVRGCVGACVVRGCVRGCVGSLRGRGWVGVFCGWDGWLAWQGVSPSALLPRTNTLPTPSQPRLLPLNLSEGVSV